MPLNPPINPDKVKQMPGTTLVPKFTDLVKRVIEEIPAQIEYHIVKAKVQRAYYLALIGEGFTKEQALELTKGGIFQ